MKSMYAQFLAEKTKDLIYEMPQGYATYRFLDEKTVYIIDIFVLPEERRGGHGTFMADQIIKEAKTKGCNVLIGSVIPSSPNSTCSMRALLEYGMTLNSATNDFVVFKKDI